MAERFAMDLVLLGWQSTYTTYLWATGAECVFTETACTSVLRQWLLIILSLQEQAIRVLAFTSNFNIS